MGYIIDLILSGVYMDDINNYNLDKTYNGR